MSLSASSFHSQGKKSSQNQASSQKAKTAPFHPSKPRNYLLKADKDSKTPAVLLGITKGPVKSETSILRFTGP
jgi:hypothetical protein